MYRFSKKSQAALSTCHADLQTILNEAIKKMDLTVVYGYRGKEEQMKCYREKKSKLKFPHSKHNKFPSLAVDVVPYPDLWKSKESLKHMAKLIFEIAKAKNIKIRWGGDFNMDGDKTTNDDWDMAHFELI